MDWWRHENDIIGRVPADIICFTLEAIASSREAEGKELPTLQDLLNAIASTLRMNRKAYCCDGKSVAVKRVVAKLKFLPDVASNEGYKVGDERLILALCKAFEAIVIQYQGTTLARKPRVRELLKTIGYVLSYRTKTFLSDTEGFFMLEIVAE